MYILKAAEVKGVLLQFKFSNFRCFADEVTFDMTATSIKEHRYSLIEKNGVNVLPVAAVYGANASGKSSFFMAYGKMRSIIVDRYLAQESPNKNAGSFSNPFIFDENNQKEPSSYQVSILIDEYEYRYGFVCTNDKIISEYLYKRKFSKNNTVEKMIFERNDLDFKVGLTNKKIKDEIEYCASMATNKILVLTDIGLRNKEKELSKIFSWFVRADTISIVTQNFMSANGFCERFIGDMLADETFDEDLKKRYKQLVNEIDPSIKDVVYEKKVDSEGNTINVAKTKHIYNGNEKIVSFNIESDGTNKWLFLSIILILALKFGSPCFIDELDSQLHPLSLRKIVQMFTDKNTNPNGAQLIFSAHNIINLDSSDLRRDEIWFIEKKNHKSTMYSLVDFDDGGVRSDLSFGKHYLAGRFGAVPFLEQE